MPGCQGCQMISSRHWQTQCVTICMLARIVRLLFMSEVDSMRGIACICARIVK